MSAIYPPFPRALCILFAVLVANISFAATYTVTNTDNNSQVAGSLPWALWQARYVSAGADTIVFAIPGAGPHVINYKLIEGVPWFLDNADGNGSVTIDATTQSGYSASNPAVRINVAGFNVGFNVTGRGNSIKGLAIYNFKIVGIALLNGGSNTIQNCWVGFNEAGGVYAKNTDGGAAFAKSIGIGVLGENNVIRDCTISGVYNGITMGNDPVLQPTPSNYFITAGTIVVGNKLGTNPSGTGAIGNLSDAIFCGDGASYNYFYENIIGANASAGIEILGSSGWVNGAWGNLCGVGVGGQNLANGQLGALVANASQYNYFGLYVPNYFYYNGLGGVSLGLNDPATGTSGACYNNQASYNYIYANNAANNAEGVGVAVTGYSMANVVQGNNIYGQAQHGVILSLTYYNWVVSNYLGYYWWNGGFGVYSQYSSLNHIAYNGFYYNYLGTYGSLSSSDYVYSNF
jgi:hypothetical protein